MVNPGAEWLAVDEAERQELVRGYHRRRGLKAPNMNLHTVAHVVVENQLAEQLPQALDAMKRLESEGLDRHQAIHAIGSVLMEHLWNLTNGPPPEGDPNSIYFSALEQLTAESWRRSFG